MAGYPTSKCKQCSSEYQKETRHKRKKSRTCRVCGVTDTINRHEKSDVCYRCSPSLAAMTPARVVAIEKLRALPKGSGTNNGMWKGGITPIHMQVRATLRYKTWRQAIRERDDFTCCLCGKRGGDIEVDHYPRPFRNILAAWMESETGSSDDYTDFWDMNNGRTLCRPCHVNTWTKHKDNNEGDTV